MSQVYATGQLAYDNGPVNFEVSTTVVGGMLVESDGASPARCRPASAGSLLCIGFAILPAVPVGTSQTPTVPGWPGPVISEAILNQYTSVAATGVWLCTYTAAAAFGQRLQCAANGQVTPITADGDPRAQVAICYEVAGVGIGGVGMTRLVLG